MHPGSQDFVDFAKRPRFRPKDNGMPAPHVARTRLQPCLQRTCKTGSHKVDLLLRYLKRPTCRSTIGHHPGRPARRSRVPICQTLDRTDFLSPTNFCSHCGDVSHLRNTCPDQETKSTSPTVGAEDSKISRTLLIHSGVPWSRSIADCRKISIISKVKASVVSTPSNSNTTLTDLVHVRPNPPFWKRSPQTKSTLSSVSPAVSVFLLKMLSNRGYSQARRLRLRLDPDPFCRCCDGPPES